MGDFQAAFVVNRATRAEAFEAWVEELESSRRIEQQIDSLDTTFWVPAWNIDASLRAILAHVTHDQVRHNGHADLLREGIDGVTGI